MTYMLKNIKMCQFEYSKFNIRYSTLKLFKFRTTNNEQRTMNNDSRPEAQPNGAKLNLKQDEPRITNLASRTTNHEQRITNHEQRATNHASRKSYPNNKRIKYSLMVIPKNLNYEKQNCPLSFR
jgi:hypothetical protein